MSRNKASQIRTSANKAIRSLQKREFAECIQNCKRVIEQASTLLLKVNGINPEEYCPKRNRHVEWNLEKKIKTIEENDLLLSELCCRLYLVKDWRNDLEHLNDELQCKNIAQIAIETLRCFYESIQDVIDLPLIEHWPEVVDSVVGSNMLPFSPTGPISAKNGQITIGGPGGQRVTLDVINDLGIWTDESGNKKHYKGNIAERNNRKGWVG